MSSLRLKTNYIHIIRFAIPISVAMIIPQINYIINNIFLSRLGETELGTAGITGVYYLIFSVIGSGFNSGLQSLLSRGAGQENKNIMGRLLAQALKLALILSAVGIVFTLVFSPGILDSQIHNSGVHDLAISFIQVRIIGLPFLYLFQVGSSFLISSNNTRYLFFGTVAEAICNIVLDYVLIFGKAGMPAFGFMGAAYASVIAEFIGMAVVFGLLWFKKLPQEFRVFEHQKWSTEISIKIFNRSLPLIIQLLFSIVSWLLFYLWIEHLGERSLAISNTMRNAFGICGITIWAMAATSNNMVSNVIGQNQLEEVIPLIKRIGLLNFLFVLPQVLFLNLYPNLFFSIFDPSADFIREAIPVLRIVTIAVLLMSQGSVWLNAISGTGLTRINLSIEILTVIIYVIYVYFAVQIKSNTLMWTWASEFFYWGVIIICSLWFFYQFPWKTRYIRE